MGIRHQLSVALQMQVTGLGQGSTVIEGQSASTPCYSSVQADWRVREYVLLGILKCVQHSKKRMETIHTRNGLSDPQASLMT